ncbi:autotransporter outer membrane beta-barrel domain-containing protein, partial [Salmonella enterica]|nr:autotransporter outer membrane beta-barrel domain-containing protein [Salmonella enterica]
MAVLNKALTRPAALFGVPLVPLVIVFAFIVIVAVYTHIYWLLLLLIPALIEMRSKARKDIHYFSLKLLEFKTRGNRKVNKFFAANTIIPGQYDSIDITEFNEKMRLNEGVSIA